MRKLHSGEKEREIERGGERERKRATEIDTERENWVGGNKKETQSRGKAVCARRTRREPSLVRTEEHACHKTALGPQGLWVSFF
jgi:hypothetical protein